MTWRSQHTKLRGLQPRNRRPIPGRSKKFFFSEVQSGSTAHSASYSAGGKAIFSLQSGRQSEAGHSIPSSADGKNECNCKPVFSYALMTCTKTSLPYVYLSWMWLIHCLSPWMSWWLESQGGCGRDPVCPGRGVPAVPPWAQSAAYCWAIRGLAAVRPAPRMRAPRLDISLPKTQQVHEVRRPLEEARARRWRSGPCSPAATRLQEASGPAERLRLSVGPHEW